MESNIPILSITILLPLISAFYISFFIGRSTAGNREQYAIYVAMLSSLLTFVSSLALWLGFDNSNAAYQFVEHHAWVEVIGLEFFVGVDGISLYFILLTTLLTLICVVASLFTVKKKIKEFLACFLLLEACCIGAFASLNLLLFYGFFEATLIPMIMIIGIWGGENRVYASLKFFLYTFAGSIFLLLALIYIYSKAGTFDMTEVPAYLSYMSSDRQNLLWWAIFVALAVKVPMLPVHTWLPDAHVQAPTAGSVMLAGVLLKLGGYAMVRILLPMLPEASMHFSQYVLWLSAIAVVYGSFVALGQSDMKKMIAYSSVAHMGYVTGGIFSFSAIGISGAIFQMISHGIISAALFLVVGILYERHHTKEIDRYGGVSHNMPVLSGYFMVFVLASVGLPGLSGFVGEFLSLVGMFEADLHVGVAGALGVVLGAVYMLSLYKRVMLGKAHASAEHFTEITCAEQLTLIPLLLLVVCLGVAPNVIFNAIDMPVAQLITIYNT